MKYNKLLSTAKRRAKKNFGKAKAAFGTLQEKAKEYQAAAPQRRAAEISKLKDEVAIANLRNKKRKLMATQSENSLGSNLNKIL